MNTTSPKESTYRCKLCHSYYDKFGLEQRFKNALAFTNGTLRSQKHANKQTIAEHSNSPGHKTIVQILKNQCAKR